ncbi:MAG: heavy-metal-associated domain-containing protein [Acidimicrobiia bacterium]
MTRVFNVPTISCDHCKQTIEQAVAAVSGVADVHVDIDARTVTVEGAASEHAVEQAITNVGYEVADAHTH